VVASSGGSTIGATYYHDANGNQVRATYVNGGTREIDYHGYDLAREIRTNVQPSTSTIRFEYTTGRGLWRRHDINGIPGGCAATADRIFCDGFQGASAATESVTYFIGNVEIRKQGIPGHPVRQEQAGKTSRGSEVRDTHQIAAKSGTPIKLSESRQSPGHPSNCRRSPGHPSNCREVRDTHQIVGVQMTLSPGAKSGTCIKSAKSGTRIK